MYECIHSILATFRLKKGVRPGLKHGSCCSWWLSEIRTLLSVHPPPEQKNKSLKIKDTVSDYKIYSLMLFCRPTLFHFHGQLSKVDVTQPLRPFRSDQIRSVTTIHLMEAQTPAGCLHPGTWSPALRGGLTRGVGGGRTPNARRRGEALRPHGGVSAGLPAACASSRPLRRRSGTARERNVRNTHAARWKVRIPS